MKRLGQWIVGGLAVVVLGVTALYVVSRLRGPSAEQEAALALMGQPMATPGRNAFAAMWLMEYDVPLAELEQVAALDVRRFAESPPPSAQSGGTEGFRSVATPLLSTASDTEVDAQPSLCSVRESGCLARVRGDREGYARRIEALAPLVERAEGLSEYGHYHYGFAPRLDIPVPQVSGALNAQLAAYSLAFVEGDTSAGLVGVCGMAGTWRGFVQHSDSLIVSMLATNVVDGASTLFAEMLAELPAEHPLPAECVVAFAPPREGEGRICEALKGELNFLQSAFSSDPEWVEQQQRAAIRLFYDKRMTDGRTASHFSHYCSAETRERFDADRILQPPAINSLHGFDCLANYMGCILADIAAPAYEGYARRGQDHVARLRLMSTLLALREQADDPRPLQARLESLPAELRSAARPTMVGDDGAALSIELFDDTRGASEWQIPLPPYLRDAASAAASSATAMGN